MSLLARVPLPGFAPFAELEQALGFVPDLFAAQTLLPGLLEAELGVWRSILLSGQVLTPTQKARILLAPAGVVPPDAAPPEAALLRFAGKLYHQPWSLSRQDIDQVRSFHWTGEGILDTILVTALGRFLYTLSVGLGSALDHEPPFSPGVGNAAQEVPQSASVDGPYLASPPLVRDLPPFPALERVFGFIPAVFLAQGHRPDAAAAQAGLVLALSASSGQLPQKQKEYIGLLVAEHHRNAYFAAFHTQMLALNGIKPKQADAIASGSFVSLDPREYALLTAARSLLQEPALFGSGQVATLRAAGFTDPQILEATVAIASFNLLNTIQFGTGAKPEFRSRPRAWAAENIPNLPESQTRPLEQSPADPDFAVVRKVQEGDINAFALLIERHSQKVYRTLVGILGNEDEARDAIQDTFLKSFENLSKFEGRAKFSTWLLSIASNTALQRLRDRKPAESLDETAEDEESFRPRQIRTWDDDPEQAFSKAERTQLVEREVRRLPAKYRVVLLLRDIQQLSTEDAAAALGLSVPAVKTRLIRGRLMLREALTAHFAATRAGGAS